MQPRAHLVLPNLLQRPGAREEGLAAPLLLEVEAHTHHAAERAQVKRDKLGVGSETRCARLLLAGVCMHPLQSTDQQVSKRLAAAPWQLDTLG